MPAKITTARGELTFVVDDEAPTESDVDCTNCPSPCCRTHSHLVFLTQTEARRLPFNVMNLVLDTGEKIANAIVLARHPVTKDCVFLGPNSTCTIYDERPKVCRSYDCRNDSRMSEFVQLRFGPK